MFQRAFRSTQDVIIALSHLPYAKTASKVKLAVVGHQAITPDIARRSFEECGVWPMKFQFMAPFCGEMTPNLHLPCPFLPSTYMAGHISNVPSSLSARSENQKTMRRIHRRRPTIRKSSCPNCHACQNEIGKLNANSLLPEPFFTLHNITELRRALLVNLSHNTRKDRNAALQFPKYQSALQ